MPRAEKLIDRRVNWTPDLKKRLEDLWMQGTPISVIGMLMGKAPTLIQTRVARDGLMLRPPPEYAERHRNKWSVAELATIDAVAHIRVGGPNFNEVEDLAIQIQRTIDSTAGKIGERHGYGALINIVEDYKHGRAVKRYVTNFLAENNISSGRKPVLCIRCRVPLFNVDPKITRYCPACRKISAGVSEGDADFWG